MGQQKQPFHQIKLNQTYLSIEPFNPEHLKCNVVLILHGLPSVKVTRPCEFHHSRDLFFDVKLECILCCMCLLFDGDHY